MSQRSALSPMEEDQVQGLLCGCNQPMLLQVLNMDQMVTHDREEQ